MKSDIDTSWEALKDAEQPHLHVFLATSPIHMEYKLMKTPDQVVEHCCRSGKIRSQKFSTCTMVRRRCVPF